MNDIVSRLKALPMYGSPRPMIIDAAIEEIESLRTKLANYDEWLSNGIYFTEEEYKKLVGESVNEQVATVVFAELKKAGRFLTPQDEKMVKDAVRNMKPLYLAPRGQ